MESGASCSVVFTMNTKPLATLIFACLAFVGLCTSAAGAQAKAPLSAMPVDVEIPRPPAPVTVDGIEHLVYEIHISNTSAMAFSLTGVEVLAGSTSTGSLASVAEAALAKNVKVFGAAQDAVASTEMLGGQRIAVFMDVALRKGQPPPHEIRHKLTFSLKAPDGSRRSKDVECATTRIQRPQARRLQPPLRGAGWVAADVLDSVPAESHRRTLMAVNGKLRAAQRYAIDWVRLGPEGRYFHDDPKDNRNWYAYGAEVLAVADGIVADVMDGLPENVAQSLPDTPVTLENIAGNYLILNLGQQRYALYAHVQPGSIKVKLGDKVKAGQVLALLGNSGNSDAPHLHFHVTDGNSALGAEGIAYGFAAFKLHGSVEQVEAVFAGSQAWKPRDGAKPEQRRGELPANYAVVEFP